MIDYNIQGMNKHIVEANVKLQDENKWLKHDKEMLITRIERAINHIEKLLKEEFVIVDEDSVDYGKKCQRAYFSDNELEEVAEILKGRYVEKEKK